MRRPKPQFLSARALCRVMRAGWGPVPADVGRVVRVVYPKPKEAADETV